MLLNGILAFGHTASPVPPRSASGHLLAQAVSIAVNTALQISVWLNAVCPTVESELWNCGHGTT